MIKTKIICTLGPVCDDEKVMRKLLETGFDCARMNFSHGSHEEHGKRLALFKKVRKELGVPTALLLDTKGPEIRTGEFDQPTELVKGEKITIVHDDIIGSKDRFSVSYKQLHQDIKPGNHILIDDGLISLLVDSITKEDINCTIENGGVVSSKKSINIPGVEINLPPLTERDTQDILFAIKHDYDFIALSFVRKASDVLTVKKLLSQNGGSDIRIIAKIENRQGIDNIDDILHVSHGIMVARGDLGVEIPVEEVPIVQKMLIRKCYNASKHVITATQMLDSMIRNPRPTRAEASDVANAIYDGTSCIMLSGETANGKYPVESLKTMRNIAQTTEESINYWHRFKKTEFPSDNSIASAISHSTCTTAMYLNAKSIITVSKGGSTAQHISRFRPQCPIICATTSVKVMHQLQLAWGVKSYYAGEVKSTDALFDVAVNIAKKSGEVEDGDTVIITAGVPVGVPGTTNMLKVQMIGDILLSGKQVTPGIATGVVCIAESYEDALQNFEDGQILVINKIDDRLLPLLRKATAIIIESNDEFGQLKSAALTLGIPALDNTPNATKKLKAGTVITVDANNGIVKNAAE